MPTTLKLASQPFKRLSRVWMSLLVLPFLLAGTPPEFQLMASEQIGPLKLGVAAKKLPAWPGCKVKLGKMVMWGADGLYHQDWDYPGCGIFLNMASDKPTTPQTVWSITIKAPSRFATRRGIHIGSTAQEALKAYAREYNQGEGNPGVSLVFGSVYGGLILTVKKGLVTEMFLGAGAE